MAMHQPCHVIMSLCSQRPKTAEKRTSNHSIDHCSEFCHDRWGHVQRHNCCQSTIWSLARTLARKTRQDYLWASACSPPCIPSLGGGCKTQTLNRLCLHSTMRHYVLASCRTWRKPGSESFLRIHSTCKKWHLKQSKRLNDNHLQAFTWQLSQVTCWDFLGWTRWQVQGKEINQNNTSSHQTFAPMTPNDNGPNRRDTKMRTEMSGTDSGQDSGAKPWRYPWTPLQWAPRQSKPASKWKLPIEKWEISHC